MRKKEIWMRKDARVLAKGKPGVITEIQEQRINDVDYVHEIKVKTDSGNLPHNPNDVQHDRMIRGVMSTPVIQTL